MKKYIFVSIVAILTVLFSIPAAFAYTVIINPNGNVITLIPTGFNANEIDPATVNVHYFVIPPGGGEPAEEIITPTNVITNSKQAIIILSVADLPTYANTTTIEGYLLDSTPFSIQSTAGFAWRRR